MPRLEAAFELMPTGEVDFLGAREGMALFDVKGNVVGFLVRGRIATLIVGTHLGGRRC